MPAIARALAALCALSAPVLAQETLYSVDATEVLHPGVLATLADVDGGGVTDFVVGAIDFSAFATSLEVRSGATGDLLFAHTVTVGFDGDSLVSVPDLDGDGKRDVVSTNHPRAR